MGVLNDYVKHLPTLKDSSKAVPTTKKGNIPFGKADLAVGLLPNLGTARQERSMLLSDEQNLLVKEEKEGCA
jgi:hypothetical protein